MAVLAPLLSCKMDKGETVFDSPQDQDIPSSDKALIPYLDATQPPVRCLCEATVPGAKQLDFGTTVRILLTLS